MIHIDYRDSKPIYKQICDGFENLIGQGILPTDSQLPSVRQLALDLSINPNTIQRAYQDMEGRGIIYSVKGRGSFVSADRQALRQQAMHKMTAALREIIADARRGRVAAADIAAALESILTETRGGAEV